MSVKTKQGLSVSQDTHFLTSPHLTEKLGFRQPQRLGRTLAPQCGHPEARSWDPEAGFRACSVLGKDPLCL